MTASPARDLERLARVRRLAASGRAAEIRKNARLGSPAVARAVGVSDVAIRRWENGDRKPSGAPALRYLEVLELLDGGDDAA